MRKLTSAVAVVALTIGLALASATSASATTDPRYPVVPQPGPGQTAVQELYSSYLYPCGKGLEDVRFTIDEAIEQAINGKLYTVQHGRYVKDNLYLRVMPAGTQCDVVYDAPPAEYPLPADFAPLYPSWSTGTPIMPKPGPAPTQTPVPTPTPTATAVSAPTVAALVAPAPQSPAAAPASPALPAWAWVHPQRSMFAL